MAARDRRKPFAIFTRRTLTRTKVPDLKWLLGDSSANGAISVRLMSPEYVRFYVKAQKNDRDAKAIAEAATRPTMRFVAVVVALAAKLARIECRITNLVGR